jgi:hypothetical protein
MSEFELDSSKTMGRKLPEDQETRTDESAAMPLT